MKPCSSVEDDLDDFPTGLRALGEFRCEFVGIANRFSDHVVCVHTARLLPLAVVFPRRVLGASERINVDALHWAIVHEKSVP